MDKQLTKNVLRGEMAKYGLTVAEMAEIIKVSSATMSDKLNGKVDFRLNEARVIVEYFNGQGESHTVDSLFFSQNTQYSG